MKRKVTRPTTATGFLRTRDYQGGLKFIRTLMRLDSLFTQVVPAIWALVFSHLDDRYRLLVLPLVNKQFKKSCRDPESWCSTNVYDHSLSYRMLHRDGSTPLLRKIASLAFSNWSNFSSQFILSARPKKVSIVMSIEIPFDIFLKKYKEAIQILQQKAHYIEHLNFTCYKSDIEIVPIFMSVPFKNLISLAIVNYALRDCDLFTVQTLCPSLVTLILFAPSNSLTCTGFDALLGCKKLRSLSMQMKTRDPTSIDVRFSRLLPQLKILILTEWRNLFCLSSTTEPWPKHQLDALYLTEASDMFFTDILTNYPNIRLPQTRELTLKKKSSISEEEFVHLLKTNPKLEVLNLIPGCPNLKQRSTFDEMTKGNLTRLTFGESGRYSLNHLIVITRDFLPFSRILNVTRESQKIVFTFPEQKREGKTMLSAESSIKWKNLRFILQRTWDYRPNDHSVPEFLNISKSAWSGLE